MRYGGGLTLAGLERLKQETDGKPITTLMVFSGGGEINAGIDFGNWVYDRGLDVVVPRACLSSCANYVFTAGRRKVILPGAIVAWHGSARQANLLETTQPDKARARARWGLRKNRQPVTEESLAAETERVLTYARTTVARQDSFFTRIGVDEFVTRVGQVDYGARGFFFMSVADMETFGIHNIVAPPDYEHTDLRAIKKLTGTPIKLIKLKNRPRHAAMRASD